MNPRLYLHIVTMEARKLMTYRADFYLNAFAGFFVQIGLLYVLWKSIFAESGGTEIAGYTFHQMVLYYVVTILIGKFVRGSDYDGRMAAEIYSGELTRYLLQPVDYFSIKFAQRTGELTTAVVQLALFSIAVPLLFDFDAELSLTPVHLAMCLVMVIFASVFHFTLFLPAEGVAFWADNVWSLNVMGRIIVSVLGGTMLPIALFPEWAQSILSYTPFPYLFYLPANILFGKVSAGEWLHGLAMLTLWTVLVQVLAREIWRRGRHSYTGVGI